MHSTFFFNIGSVSIDFCFSGPGVRPDECARRRYDRNSFVCVCNSTYCDAAPSVGPLAAGRATLVLSTRDDARFRTSDLSFVPRSNTLNGWLG